MLTDNKLYSLANFTINEIHQGELNFNSLLNNELSGFIVNDFLNATEINTIIQGFRSLSQSELVHINKGFDSYPMSFAQLEQMVHAGQLKEEDYFSISKNFNSHFQNKFGVNVFQKLQWLFQSLKNSPTVERAPNEEKSGFYVPFTFRELFPGEGNLKAHCENLFYKEFPGFFNRISKFSIPDDQFSFFIVLQSPGSGGELSLFDLIWDNHQKRPNDHKVILSDGRTLDFEDASSLKRDTLPCLAGSLVVFSGGKIWHRIETIRTAPSRITLGGFLSFSRDKSKLYSWS